MKILMVGGTFDENGGHPSKMANIIFSSFAGDMLGSCKPFPYVSIINGGTFEELKSAVFWATNVNVVLWFADVPDNGLPKLVEDIKKKNPTCLLVMSKRKREGTNLADLVQKMLSLHANLCVEFDDSFCKGEKLVSVYDPLGNMFCSVYDPLGNVFCKHSSDMREVGHVLAERVLFLRSLTRIGSRRCLLDDIRVPDVPEFFNEVRLVAGVLEKLLPVPTKTERFLGNASFRCSRGFPSFRGDNGFVYVSKRNIDKASIDRNGFVPVRLESDNGSLVYFNPDKPSVDAPTQCLLYRLYPNINYMIHGHAYSDVAHFTPLVLPCGALEEAREVFNAVPDCGSRRFVVNLSCHGFLVAAECVDGLRGLELYARPFPE